MGFFENRKKDKLKKFLKNKRCDDSLNAEISKKIDDGSITAEYQISRLIEEKTKPKKVNKIANSDTQNKASQPKRDFAKEFKDKFYIKSSKQLADIYVQWSKSGTGKEDANFDFASVIILSLTPSNENLVKAIVMMNHALEGKPLNKELHTWYMETAYLARKNIEKYI